MVLLEMVVGTTNNEEDDGQNQETGHLNWLAADGVNGSNGEPVAWDSTGADQDQIAHCITVECLEHILASGPANRAEDGRVIETETIERYSERIKIRSFDLKRKEKFVDEAYQRRGKTTSPQYPEGL